jgi:hypothetical protein
MIDRDKTAKLIAMIGSEPERENAIRALQRSGVSWTWIAEQVERSETMDRQALFTRLLKERVSEALSASWVLTAIEAKTVAAMAEHTETNFEHVGNEDIALFLGIADAARWRVGGARLG